MVDEIRRDIQALVQERGMNVRLISEIPLSGGPRPTFDTQTIVCKAVRQNNTRRFSPWQSEDGDALVTIAVGVPPVGIQSMPGRGFYVQFFDIAPDALPTDGSKAAYGERWNVIQSRDRRVDGEIVAFTLLVRR